MCALSALEAVPTALAEGRPTVVPDYAAAVRKAAHDIRTPLAAVTQGVDALLNLTNDGDGAQRLFNIVRRNVVLMGEVLASSVDRGLCAALPMTERLADEVLSLPMYPELSDADVELVARAVKDCVASAQRLAA